MSNVSITHQMILPENNILLIIVLIGIVFHSILWFQLYIHRIKLNLSFLYPFAYLLTDFLLMFAYLIEYVIEKEVFGERCRLLCYYEAYFIFFIDITESFYLCSLCITRYYQIVHQINVYIVYRYQIKFLVILIPLFVLFNIIIQDSLTWCIVIEEVKTSCSLSYQNLPIRFWNEIFLFILPILISIIISIRTLIYINNKNNNQLFQGSLNDDHHHHHHHRRSINRFFIFYIIWLILWGPYVFVTYLDAQIINNQTEFIIAFLTTLDTTIDPILLCHLDERFALAWNKTFHKIKSFLQRKTNQQIHPII